MGIFYIRRPNLASDILWAQHPVLMASQNFKIREQVGSVVATEWEMDVNALGPDLKGFVAPFSERHIIGSQKIINEAVGPIADALDSISSLQFLPLVPRHADMYFAIAGSK
jgi:hypothetical protein